jgi:hypothetical protein
MMKNIATCALALFVVACEGSEEATTTEVPPCDQACKDATALRAVRETVKLAFNLGLQGKPVGAQDVTVACTKGGKAHITGTATANPVIGTTEVALTYTFEKCAYAQKATEPKESYATVLEGTIVEEGVLAATTTATTALVLRGHDLVLTGTVNDPPIPYEERGCALDIAQNGNLVAGTLCTRQTGFDFTTESGGPP